MSNQPKHLLSTLALPALLMVVLGIFFRLRQFGQQVLLDDEWHAVHQLLSGKTPADLFVTFGHADYSIPLGIFYWIISHSMGLSEALMRMPMALAGALTLFTFVWWCLQQFGYKVAAIFAFLIAFSPMLIIYSHTARPYALTLLLSYGAIFCLVRWRQRAKTISLSLVTYVALAALCVWLHPVTGPFVVAPLMYFGFEALFSRNWALLKSLVLPSVSLLAALLALLGPPLSQDYLALAGKAGAASFNFQTLVGVWHFWFGLTSLPPTILIFLLACVGAGTLFSQALLARIAVLGLALTFVALIVTQPAWAQHPVTFGRYMLPALPLALMAVAIGTVSAYRTFKNFGSIAQTVYLFAAVCAPIWYLNQSNTLNLLIKPNSQINHSAYQFDLMNEGNPIREYQAAHIPNSTFWNALRDSDQANNHIAVAPFYFETHHWDAVRWERQSAHRMFPLALSGACVDHRYGEVPRNQHFQFRNVVYPADLTSPSPRVSWVVLIKPFTVPSGETMKVIGADSFEPCQRFLVHLLGAQDYEDDLLLAFRLPSETPTADK